VIGTLVEQGALALTLSAQYALLAIGLTLVVAVARLINFAHGELFMLGAFAFWFFSARLGVGYWPAVAATTATMGLAGAVYERLIVDPLLHRSWRTQLIGTLAASIVLVNLAILAFGGIPRDAPSPYTEAGVTLAGARLTAQRLVVVGFTVLAFVALQVFIARTRTGKAIRAIAQNREACRAFGIDVRRMATITLAISGALAGLGSALVVPLYNIHPTMGTILTFKALAAIILGGLGNVYGALTAALVLGCSETLAIHALGSEYAEALVFAVMVVMLLVRPRGLLGHKVGL
jgi:branched-chain amino acid transport system permease protein